MSVLYDMPKTPSAEGRANLRAFAESGARASAAWHHALCSYNDWEWYRELVGGRYLIRAAQGGLLSVDLQPRRDDYGSDGASATHHPRPGTHGSPRRNLQRHAGLPADVTLLLTTSHARAAPAARVDQPSLKSRVVAIPPPHGREAHGHPGYLVLLCNAIFWSAWTASVSVAKPKCGLERNLPFLCGALLSRPLLSGARL